MIVLKIVLLMIGILFCIFGYLIYYKGKYVLINDYEKDNGKYDENYARRIGIIEFIGGIFLSILGLISFILSNTIVIIIFIISILSLIIVMVFNEINFIKNKR
jgi:hypothetical protein